MKKQLQKTKKVKSAIARFVTNELKDEALSSVSGGCSGDTPLEIMNEPN